MPLEVVHDVERDADHALVLADGADRRQPDAVRCERELEARLPHHVVRGRRQRRPRRAAEDEAGVVALEQEREVRAAALADPARAHRPRAEPVRVQERLDALEDEQRRPVEPIGLGSASNDAGCLRSAHERTLRHRRRDRHGGRGTMPRSEGRARMREPRATSRAGEGARGGNRPFPAVRAAGELPTGEAAVDDERVPGDVVGGGRGEEDDRALQVVGAAEAAQRDVLEVGVPPVRRAASCSCRSGTSRARSRSRVIPCRAHFVARSRVNETTPPFDAL